MSQPQGRGRSRGRSRGTDQQQAQGQAAPGGYARGPPAGPQRGGPRGPPGGAGQPPRRPPPQQQQQQPQQQQQQTLPIGRALYRGGEEVPPGAAAVAEFQSAGAGAEPGLQSGGPRVRGRVRAGRPVDEHLITKPNHVVSKQGSTGQPVALCANYFEVLKKPDWCLLQYRVDFDPEEDRTGLKKFLFRRAVSSFLKMYMFDGTVMYAVQRLQPLPMELFVEDERNDNKRYRITVKMVGDIAPGDFASLQFFNIIMRKCLGHLKLQLVGRNFFDEAAKIVLAEHKIQIWPGYLTSIRQHERKLLLCSEISHKVLRTDTVYNFLESCLQEDRQNYKEKFGQGIIGSVVLTKYNNKTYHIDDVDWACNPNSTFKMKDGSSMSYIEYYKKKYAINIAHTTQPMLLSRAKAREIRAGMAELIYLVPEVCYMTGLSEQQRANFQLMKVFADHTRVGPSERIQKLIDFSRRLRQQPDVMNELRQWDFGLADRIVEFSGRVLQPESLLAGNNKRYSASKNVDWSRFVRESPFTYGAPIESWVIMCTNRNRQASIEFAKMLQRVAQGMSWSLPQPRIHEMRNDSSGAYLEGIDVVAGYNPSLIMCVVANNKQDRYSVIKKKCYVDLGIPSQVIQQRNLTSKGAMSIATKVAIQMNCKLGGIPWTIPMPVKGIMIVGFDVCHDANQKTKSYGAMVASLGFDCMHYYSACTHHMNGEELSNSFAMNVIKAAQAAKQKYGAYPEKIMIVRDGVGDGQLPYVYEHEVKTVKDALEKNIYNNGNLKMTFIVVSKRINTRIFSKTGQNPDPGTVVDDCITLPERYDFFIVSQSVRQGTVAPTNYNVLHDTLGCSPDQLQRLVYKLCHLYYNWSGGIRVPAQCQYAHKLAFLVSQNLHQNPHPNLQNLLYFL